MLLDKYDIFGLILQPVGCMSFKKASSPADQSDTQGDKGSVDLAA